MGSPPRAQGCSFAAALAKARVPAGCDLTQTRLTTFGFKVRIRRARWVGCGICRAEERKVTTWAGWGSSGQTFKCNRDPPGVPALRPCFPSAARRSRTNLSAQIPGGVQCWDSHVHPGRPSPWSLLVLKWRCKCERAQGAARGHPFGERTWACSTTTWGVFGRPRGPRSCFLARSPVRASGPGVARAAAWARATHRGAAAPGRAELEEGTGRRTPRGLQCPPPDGGAQNCSGPRGPAPHLCVGDARPLSLC